MSTPHRRNGGGQHRAGAPDPAPDIRAALERSAASLPESADLLGAVQLQAGRITRTRRVRVAVGSGLAAVVVIAGGTVLATQLGGGPTTAPPAATGTPRPTGSVAPTPTTATPVVTPPAGSGSATATGGGHSTNPTTTPAGTWGAPTLATDFTSGALPTGWVRYDSGTASPLSTWSAANVAVGGGILRLSVTRTAGGAHAGGVGATESPTRYGRYELRWRMTDGLGVIGQFGLFPPDSGEARYLANLIPYTHTLSLQDLTTNAGKELTVTPGFHTLAIEWTPTRVRWLLDNTPVVDFTTSAATPLWPAVQTLMSGPDCGGSTLPADCGGARTTFPQTLDVDWLRYWAYHP